MNIFGQKPMNEMLIFKLTFCPINKCPLGNELGMFQIKCPIYSKVNTMDNST